MNLEILPIHGLPKIQPGDDLIAMLGDCGEIQSFDIPVSYTHLTLPTKA